MDIKEIMEFNAVYSNGKTIELITKLCDVWGYDYNKEQVISLIIDNLNEKGYDVKSTFVPLGGGKGEYYIYKAENDGKEKIVFSNNDRKHKSLGAIIGDEVHSNNVKSILDLILN